MALVGLHSSLTAQNIAASPLVHAHSHNDYLKKEPLWGALKNGCASIEIDVFAYQNELKVAHVGLALKKRKTFQSLYLFPLVEYLQNHDWIYQGHPLVLMIDFKTAGHETLPILLKQIEAYHDLFTYVTEDSIHLNPLQLVISGKGFSYDAVADSDTIYTFVDGSVYHCNPNYPSSLVERGSARYGSIFSWKGKGVMPVEEKNELLQLIKQAEECQTNLRFYAMPEKEKIWETFLDAGVHWINVDDAKHFRKFYLKRLNKKVP